MQANTTYWVVFLLVGGTSGSASNICENTASPIRTNPAYPRRFPSNGFLNAGSALSNYGPTVRINGTPTAPPCPADLNNEGGINGADVETFFIAWENGGC